MNNEEIKNKLLELFKLDSWEKQLSDYMPENILWATRDLLKEDEIGVHEAMIVAKHYQFDPDPLLDSDVHKEIEKGEDVRTIKTVRGSLCWLLLEIVRKLEPAYFSDVLDLLEGTSSDREEQKKLRLATGENLYIRTQAAITLSLLTANMRAKKNFDGTPFDFGEENRNRTEKLAFRMLRENRKYPRVLEYLAQAFDGMRYLKEKEAQEVLESFFYKEDTKLNPDYVLNKVAQLAIFFAEFRKEDGGDFNNYFFVSFLKKIIQEATPGLKSTIIWHFWKACEKNHTYFVKFKKYLSLFFKPPFQSEIIHQIDLLIEKMIKTHPKEMFELFKEELNYIKSGIREKKPTIMNIWISSSEIVLRKILEIEPENFMQHLNELFELWKEGVYIGDPQKIFSLYKEIPPAYESDIIKGLKDIYSKMKSLNPNIKEVDW